jgi:membrane protease YdiL (CAAX protease family)
MTPATQPRPATQERKELLLFTLAVLGLTTVIIATLHQLHVTNNWAANALMFVPGSVAIALLLRSGTGVRSIGWGTGPAIYWFWAIALPVIALAMSLPISIWLGFAALAPASTKMGALASQPLKILENVLIYTAISIPFALGEEIGWRGYAQGRLVRQFGLLKGFLLLGLIWGFWHSPIYYFMGTDAAHPILGPFVMTPIDNILAVVPMAWLYIRSRNICVPTFMHAFADVLWGFSGLLFPASNETATWAILQATQVVISAVLLRSLMAKPAEAAALAFKPLPVPESG